MKVLIALVLALLAACALAGGIAWIYPPAGLIVAGAELAGAAYVLLYIERQERR